MTAGKGFLGVWLWLVLGGLVAAESPADQGPSADGEPPIEMETLVTTSEQLDWDSEMFDTMTLRLIKQGLDEPRRSGREYRDRLVCRHQQGTGTRRNYVVCATNEVWDAGNPDLAIPLSDDRARAVQGLAAAAASASLRQRTTGDRLVLGPMSRARVENRIAALEARDYNEQIVSQVLGANLDVPEEVLDGTLYRLAELHVALDEIRLDWQDEILAAEGAERDALVARMDEALEAAVRSAGYTVAEYNEQVARFESDPELLEHKREAVAQVAAER